MAGEMNNFLESMTFAKQDCDCDECGIGGLGNGPPMKSAVEEAFDKYRSSTNYAVSSRHQERKLIRREEDMNTGLVVTLYSMSLPVGALPLLEYGDSARIVFVIGLPKTSAIMQVDGNSKRQTKWRHNGMYFLRNNGGNPIGWVNERAIGTTAIDDDIRILVAKVSGDLDNATNYNYYEESCVDEDWKRLLVRLHMKSTFKRNRIAPGHSFELHGNEAEHTKVSLLQLISS